MNHIVDASDRMMTLIADLLQFARLGKQSIVMEPVDLNEIASETVATLGPQMAEAMGIVIVAESPPRVLGNRALLQQVFNNLKENATKYRRADPPPNVKIGWKPGEKHQCVTIFFKENGIGIPNQLLESFIAS